MRRIIFGCTAALFVIGFVGGAGADAKEAVKAAARGGGPLDGKTYAIKIGQEGKPTSDDKVSFTNGTFGSDLSAPLGFVRVKYGAHGKGDSWTFSAETKSPKEGRTTWKGTIKGDLINGGMTWNKEGQALVRYIFAGSLVK